jgi:AcrR family transcriptional regulator
VYNFPVGGGETVAVTLKAEDKNASLRWRRNPSGTSATNNVDRLLDGALDVLRESRFEGLTVRGAARKAGLATTTAYTYFSSKEHLVTELFWRSISALPIETPSAKDTAERVTSALTPIVRAVLDEPELARACTRSLLADEPDVRRLRDQISENWRSRVASAVGDRAQPDQIETLMLAWVGLLLSAGTGHFEYSDIPRRLASVANVTMPPR